MGQLFQWLEWVMPGYSSLSMWKVQNVWRQKKKRDISGVEDEEVRSKVKREEAKEKSIRKEGRKKE